MRTSNYRFNPVGSLERVELPNGIAITYGYTASNRLLGVGSDFGGQALARFDYTLRPGGHRSSLTERIGAEQMSGTARVFTWTYDAAYRLASETISAGAGDAPASAGSVNYGHDSVGNRTFRTVTGGLSSNLTSIASGAYNYDVRDRLRAAGSSTFNYDENGSTTSAAGLPTIQGSSRTGTVADTYDHDNRLLQRTETGPGGRTITILYDADGNRVRTKRGSAEMVISQMRNGPGGRTRDRWGE